MLNEVCGPVAKTGGRELACVTFDDLVITAAQREKATVLVRGLRNRPISTTKCRWPG